MDQLRKRKDPVHGKKKRREGGIMGKERKRREEESNKGEKMGQKEDMKRRGRILGSFAPSPGGLYGRRGKDLESRQIDRQVDVCENK